jgi:PKHD-type hydroxylase
MHYQIFSVLDPSQVEGIVGELAHRTFVDGKATAQGLARDVKNNLQADRAGAALDPLDELVKSALYATSGFHAFAFPKRIQRPIFSRYEPGMEYGAHVDSAIMNTSGEVLRTDLAITLFLSPPDCYEGGELKLELPYGEEEIKLAAGEAVIYSASTVHRVAPVTRGARLAAVTWVQSAVRDERMRAILFDLFLALREAEQTKGPVLLLSKAYHNLLRIVSEI